MSALTGLWNWDGHSVSKETLDTLAAHSRRAGPDRSDTVFAAPTLAMQAHTLHFDSLSANERQPYHFAQGAVLTWDGRLDNREDLLLQFRSELQTDRSDPALVALAYARWGTDAVRRLIGDWSLAIWDPAHRVVILARDYMGNRPLYYATTPHGLAWSTTLEALVAAFDLYGNPDESYIAGALTFGVAPEVTPFKGVQALRAGHMLRAYSGRVTVERYWTFSPETVHYRDVEAYADRLRSLLSEAVQVRLRATRRVWAHLSGGWDSSSIVCLAHSLIANGCAEASELKAVSLVYPETPESNETEFITSVEQWCGLKSVPHLFRGYYAFDELLDQTQPVSPLPPFGLENVVAAAGDHIVMGGEPGDLVMRHDSSSRLALLEPLLAGHPLQSLRLCAARSHGHGRTLAAILFNLAREACLTPARRIAIIRRHQLESRARTSGVSLRDRATALGVTPRALQLGADCSDVPAELTRDFPITKRALANDLYMAMDFPGVTSPDTFPSVWQTFPYTHRPLVEFVLAAPGLALWDPVVVRAGMRRALVGVLPPKILSRATKGSNHAGLTVAKRKQEQRLVESRTLIDSAERWQLVRNGYVNLGVLRGALERLYSTSTAAPYLIKCLHIEAWLRSLETTTRKVKSTSQPGGGESEASRAKPLQRVGIA